MLNIGKVLQCFLYISFWIGHTKVSFQKGKVIVMIPHNSLHQVNNITWVQFDLTHYPKVNNPVIFFLQVPGYVGVVFCPEKILCSQSDHTTPVNNLDHVIFPVPDSSVADLYYSHAHQTADPNLTFDADLLSSVPWESAKVIVPALLALASALSLIIVFGATYKVLSVQVRVHAEAPDVVVELS
ncbi:hypothetical protein AALO_G00298670 [Alosa alosa]|uniref:Uncharacterized protein n=1 Tax=Alosa alosa TaxID=278164 RepID=A0AAV6FIM7_9TELE|nr:hypothetical protein AALO_G00298670 [Alosa alosa]